MKLGIFAKTFDRSSVEAVFDAVRDAGLRVTQFNMSCAGLPSMPESIPMSLAYSVGEAAAWRDLCDTMERALSVAETHDVTLAFEPEHANVVDSAQKGVRLIEEMGSSRLKVIFDAANLFETASPDERRRLVEEGIDLLGEHVVMAHAKDRRADGTFCPAGHGVLDYDHYVEQLRAADVDAPLVLHGLSEDEVPGRVAFLQERLKED
jgi:sugar phosphate isomerase/epimerase